MSVFFFFFFSQRSSHTWRCCKVLFIVSKQEPSPLQFQMSFSSWSCHSSSVHDFARRLIRIECPFARRSHTLVFVPVVARTINKAYIFRRLVTRLYSALVKAVVQCSWTRVLGTEVYKRKESLTSICCEMTNNNDTILSIPSSHTRCTRQLQRHH